MTFLFFSFLGLLLSIQSAMANDAVADSVGTQLGTQLTLVSEQNGYLAGQTQWIGVQLDLQPQWHTYWLNAGASGAPAQVSFSSPPSVVIGAPRWPSPSRKVFSDLNVYGYEDRLLLMFPMQVPADWSGPLNLKADVNWLVCKDICVPESGTVAVTLGPASGLSSDAESFARTRSKIPSAQPLEAIWDPAGRLQVTLPDGFDDSSNWAFFPFDNSGWPASNYSEVRASQGHLLFNGEPADGIGPGIVVHLPSAQSWTLVPQQGVVESVGTSLLMILVFALFGGALLNLMPCVFPILSIKALGLAQSSGDARGKRLRKGLLFTAGVLSSFWLLAAVLVGLRFLGSQIGWGFQLQSPWFVFSMAALMALIAANLIGWFEWSMGWAGVGQRLTQGEGGRADFFTGVLAVVVASPCTAPLMGPAMGYALAAPALTTFLVFGALALGLALPMLALYASKTVARALPRPGAWMNRFKQLMAFPMLLTALWLFWVGARQIGWAFDFVWLLLGVLVGFAFWVWSQFPTTRYRWAGVVLLAAVGTQHLVNVSQPKLQWQPFSADALAQARTSGQPVLVNMTADWCISCLANEQLVFDQPEMADLDALWLKGDWTEYDPAITQYLNQYQRIGVPLYVVYRPDSAPQILPQVLTLQLVNDALFGSR